jgi:hypothetical protein
MTRGLVWEHVYGIARERTLCAQWNQWTRFPVVEGALAVMLQDKAHRGTRDSFQLHRACGRPRSCGTANPCEEREVIFNKVLHTYIT